MSLLRTVRRRLGRPESLFAEGLLLAFVLLYYPSNYWGLMGMETSLVTLWALLALRLALGQDETRVRVLPWLGVVLGLAFWTRPDALILAALLLAYRAYALGLRAWRVWFMEGLIVLAFVTALSLFRLVYYGALVPNTYTLKVGGMPLLPRLRDGLGFIAPYLATTTALFGLGLLGLMDGLRAWWQQLRANRRSWWRLDMTQRTLSLLALVVILHVAYQIWTGGDPWPYWRMLVPAMPALFVLAVLGLEWLMARLAQRLPAALGKLGALALAGFSISLALQPFLPELIFQKSAYRVGYHVILAERAVLLNEILRPGARLAVFSAGIVPYYTDFHVIDMLGKNDTYIASLPPDRSGAVSWHGMNSVPGHNKYDLFYSIETQQATYAERLSWGAQGLRVPRMTEIHLGRLSFFLDLSSPYVDQEALQARLAQAESATAP
ncbi:MAG: glycosyltransferase family 39 protein [Anaerolineae bacterium]|nr:glycosyltransferase family 39 protein [Anaerolineae bacterium]